MTTPPRSPIAALDRLPGAAHRVACPSLNDIATTNRRTFAVVALIVANGALILHLGGVFQRKEYVAPHASAVSSSSSFATAAVHPPDPEQYVSRAQADKEAAVDARVHDLEDKLTRLLKAQGSLQEELKRARAAAAGVAVPTKACPPAPAPAPPRSPAPTTPPPTPPTPPPTYPPPGAGTAGSCGKVAYFGRYILPVDAFAACPLMAHHTAVTQGVVNGSVPSADEFTNGFRPFNMYSGAGGLGRKESIALGKEHGVKGMKRIKLNDKEMRLQFGDQARKACCTRAQIHAMVRNSLAVGITAWWFEDFALDMLKDICRFRLEDSLAGGKPKFAGEILLVLTTKLSPMYRPGTGSATKARLQGRSPLRTWDKLDEVRMVDLFFSNAGSAYVEMFRSFDLNAHEIVDYPWEVFPLHIKHLAYLHALRWTPPRAPRVCAPYAPRGDPRPNFDDAFVDPSRFGFPATPPLARQYIVSTGRSQRDHKKVVQAAAMLNIPVVVKGVGETKAEAAALASECARHQLCRFLGDTVLSQHEYTRLLLSARFMVSPVQAKGKPNHGTTSLLEAGMAGRALVVPQFASTADAAPYVEDGATGLVLRESTVAGYRAALDRLWFNESLVRRFERRALERMAKFTPFCACAVIYEQVCARRTEIGLDRARGPWRAPNVASANAYNSNSESASYRSGHADPFNQVPRQPPTFQPPHQSTEEIARAAAAERRKARINGGGGDGGAPPPADSLESWLATKSGGARTPQEDAAQAPEAPATDNEMSKRQKSAATRAEWVRGRGHGGRGPAEATVGLKG